MKDNSKFNTTADYESQLQKTQDHVVYFRKGIGM